MPSCNNHLVQNRAPLFDALKKYISDGVIPFHVPGHKGGRGITKEFKNYVGSQIFRMDVNGMEDLDNICNPVGVIKEAEELMADLFKADDSFLLVNGTSQGVHAMILYACEPGQEIIIPRNAHKSAIGALILSGAIPIYIQPEIHDDLGISMGIDVQSFKSALNTHPNARAVFINNPTYYGAASNLRDIINIAHQRDMLVLVDEAHGSHLTFHPDLPPSAMTLGADMSAISLHKTGGSMTQSSVLLSNEKNINPSKIKTTLNLLQTTSASYILMASLDLARKNLALRGPSMIKSAVALANYGRQKINEIDGLYAFGPELVGQAGVFAFDKTKLCINVRKLGISGYQTESILRKEYNIQVEMSDFHNILAIISLGDDEEQINSLIEALKNIAIKYGVHNTNKEIITMPNLEMIISPREAYYCNKKSVLLDLAIGEISGEMAMAYPPGIPAICPGERITKEIVDYIKMMKKSQYQLQGTEDPYLNYINILSS